MLDPRRNADPARWGLVPDAQVREHRLPEDDPALHEAAGAARSGRWRPAATLLASTVGEWDRRAEVVAVLATEGANDDRWLTAWRAAHPDDPHLAVVDAHAWLELAWAIRGDGLEPAHVKGFERVLAKAERAARAAAAALPDDPTPWWTLTALARGLGFEHSRFQEVWAEVTARAPSHRRAHLEAVQYWREEWCGSHGLLLDFAEKAAAASPDLAALPLHAAFELEDAEPGAWRTASARAALEAVLARLADAPDTRAAREDRGFAVLALFELGRYGEVVEQFRLLGPRADGAPWSNYDDPKGTFLNYRADACMRAAR
ncbi:MAG: DUF4034 domain-containing protein [Saccharothrix sp.]|nr:DUF4034 domain-containing protein [Saccharothrix sp.]